jgi:hypothetical protein
MTHIVVSECADGAAMSQLPANGADADQSYLALAAEILMARTSYSRSDEAELTRHVRRQFALRRWRGLAPDVG